MSPICLEIRMELEKLDEVRAIDSGVTIHGANIWSSIVLTFIIVIMTNYRTVWMLWGAHILNYYTIFSNSNSNELAKSRCFFFFVFIPYKQGVLAAYFYSIRHFGWIWISYLEFLLNQQISMELPEWAIFSKTFFC